jgi:electron transfer flavoprotein alpha subunit
MLKNVWVFAEKIDAIAELCSGGRSLGEQVSALWLGSKEDAEKLIAFGADKVYWLGENDPARMYEDYTETIAALLKEQQPDLLMIGTTKRCRLIAGRLAASLGISVSNDVMEFSIEDDGLQVKKMVYGGAAIRTEKALSKTAIATVGLGVFEKTEPDTSRQGEIENVEFREPELKIKLREKKAKEGESVNLAAAKRVVVVGRGIAKQEDLQMIEELAELLEAEIGCTRPIAEGVNWLPRERYIGVSGVMFKPELYIGIGVSGQIQHMVGCNQARTIVAINKDKAAPIFAQADYGLVGDLYKIVPQLIEKIKASK